MKAPKNKITSIPPSWWAGLGAVTNASSMFTNCTSFTKKEFTINDRNADITANASGDLSLLDANGNFTGVCP